LDTWASWRKFGIDKNQFFQLLDEAWDDWENIPPTEPNLAEKVSRIKSLGSLDVVTGRSKRTVESAKNWLKHHRIPYQRFIRVPGMRDKIHLNYDVYIDDAPELMPLISRNPDMVGILYQRPWNQNVPDMPKISKVKSWSEIPRTLRQTIRDAA
jgi:hypothetical protein